MRKKALFSVEKIKREYEKYEEKKIANWATTKVKLHFPNTFLHTENYSCLIFPFPSPNFWIKLCWLFPAKR